MSVGCNLGAPAVVHLPQFIEGGVGFQSNSIAPVFTPDGNSLFVATSSREALLWRVTTPPAEIPTWFPEFLETVAGQKFIAGTDMPAVVTPDYFLAMRRRLLTSTNSDYYTRWARQWLLAF